MANPDLFRLRVTFRKAGRCAMLSHLEIARALERAVRRAGLPYAVSQGFSPHMKIAFGAALPVGVGGLEEIFDVQLLRWVDPAEALAALQRSSVEDLMPSACAYIGPREAAASVAFPVGEYEAVFSAPLATLALPETVTVVRKKKERTLTVADYLVGEVLQEPATLDGARFAEGRDGLGGVRSGKGRDGVVDSAAGEPRRTGARDDSRRTCGSMVDSPAGSSACVRFTLRALPTGSLRPDLVTAELAKANPGVELQKLTRVRQRAC